MPSPTGKLAALYVPHSDRAAALAAVSEVEDITSGLGRKIWRTIMLPKRARGIEGSILKPVDSAIKAIQPPDAPEPA